jgi:transcription elongation factor GreA-like protein
VVLLSTEHYKAEIEDEDPQQKPVIITHYNDTKGGVDTLDHMVNKCSCKRQKNRWPVVLFMNIVDISAINAFVLWKDIHPNWKEAYTHRRRLFLLRLGKLLVEPMMKRRLNDPSIRNTQSTKMLEMMTKCLENMEEDTGNERGSEMEPRWEHSQPATSGTEMRKR